MDFLNAFPPIFLSFVLTTIIAEFIKRRFAFTADQKMMTKMVYQGLANLCMPRTVQHNAIVFTSNKIDKVDLKPIQDILANYQMIGKLHGRRFDDANAVIEVLQKILGHISSNFGFDPRYEATIVFKFPKHVEDHGVFETEQFKIVQELTEQYEKAANALHNKIVKEFPAIVMEVLGKSQAL